MTSGSFVVVIIPVRYNPGPISDDMQLWLRFRSSPLGRMGGGGDNGMYAVEGPLGVYGGGDRFG